MGIDNKNKLSLKFVQMFTLGRPDKYQGLKPNQISV